MNIRFNVTVTYGKVVFRSWLQPTVDRIVGMGSCTTYNDAGVCVDYQQEATGTELILRPNGSVSP